MSKPRQLNHSERVLRDMLGDLSQVTASRQTKSLAVLGCGASDPRPPEHCLRACLKNDPTSVDANGCSWLTAASMGRLDTSGLNGDKCPKGFSVAAETVSLGGRTGFVLSVEGACGREERASHVKGFERLESLSRILQHVGDLLEENEGLAEEVLRSYEQINLIFEFTHKIAQVTETPEVEARLLSSLGELLHATNIAVVSDDDTWRIFDVSDKPTQLQANASAAPTIGAVELDGLRRSGKVSVFSRGDSHLLGGPLVRLDGRVDIVLVTRPREACVFTSGDMLLIESVLSFGGQIISNCELHEKLRRMSVETTRALVSAIDQKDHYTCGHSERVSLLAMMVGRELGLLGSDLQSLEWAGLLHDVGKIGVPEEVLNKPGKLTDEEFEIIKKHPEMGYEILRPIASFQSVLESVLHHHENPDGSGYPYGLTRDEIPYLARILHVVDVFDALSSSRSYRAAFRFDQSLEIIRKESGTKLDSEIVAAFEHLIAEMRRKSPGELERMYASEKAAAHD